MASGVLRVGMAYFAAAAVICVFVSQASPPPRGHPFPIPPDDPHLQPAVNFAAASVNQECNCAFCQTVIVEGAVFAFSLSLQDSEKCMASQCMENVTSSQCPPSPHAKSYWCHATVLAVPWTHHPYVMQNLTCDESVY